MQRSKIGNGYRTVSLGPLQTAGRAAKEKPGGDQAKALNQLAKEIQQSVRACQARDMAIPRQMCYPAELPVRKMPRLVLIRDHQVLIVAGDTGQ